MRRNDNFVMRDIGGQCVLVPLGSQVIAVAGLLILNETGRYVWEILAKECSIEDIVASVVNQYEVNINTAIVDIQNFFDEIMASNFSEVIYS